MISHGKKREIAQMFSLQSVDNVGRITERIGSPPKSWFSPSLPQLHKGGAKEGDMATFEVNTGSRVITVEASGVKAADSFGVLVFYDQIDGASRVTKVFAPGTWLQATMTRK